MCILGILGNNWLAVVSFPRKISQIRTNEALFFNLAISNLIANYFVDLPDTMADFAGKWFMGRTYCAVFVFCSNLSATSSIISTMLIAVFWHQKLVGPRRGPTTRVPLDNLRLVASLLAGGWGVALAFSVPQFYFIRFMSNDSLDDCVESFPSLPARQMYEVMYLALANAVPIAGMVFSSIQIVITLLRHQARIKAMNSEVQSGAANPESNKDEESRNEADGNQAQHQSPEALSAQESSKQRPKEALSVRPNKPTSNPGNQVRAAKSVVAVASVFLVCWLTHLLLRITSNVNKSSLVVEVASYIAASYTCIIPYIFLYGIRKLSRCCCYDL